MGLGAKAFLWGRGEAGLLRGRVKNSCALRERFAFYATPILLAIPCSPLGFSSPLNPTLSNLPGLGLLGNSQNCWEHGQIRKKKLVKSFMIIVNESL